MPPKVIEVKCMEMRKAPPNHPRRVALERVDVKDGFYQLAQALLADLQVPALVSKFVSRRLVLAIDPKYHGLFRDASVIEWPAPWYPNGCIRSGCTFPTRYAVMLRVARKVTERACLWEWKAAPLTSGNSYETSASVVSLSVLAQIGYKALQRVMAGAENPLVPLSVAEPKTKEECPICLEANAPLDRVWTCCHARSCESCSKKCEKCPTCCKAASPKRLTVLNPAAKLG